MLLLNFFNTLGVVQCIQNDVLIQSFCHNLLGRLGRPEEQRRTDVNIIRNKLRSVARLVLRMREITSTNKDLNGYLVPGHFDEIVLAAKDLSDSPQLTLTLGHYVKQTCMLKMSAAIKTNNPYMRKEAEDVIYLFNAHWLAQVSSVASRRQRLLKLNKPEPLPETEDLKALSEFLRGVIESTDDRQKLSKACLAQLILFNKRRPMEVAEITKEDFQSISMKQQDNQEMLQSLDTTEALLVKR